MSAGIGLCLFKCPLWTFLAKVLMVKIYNILCSPNGLHLSLANKYQKQGNARPKVNLKKDGKHTNFHGIVRDLRLSKCKHFYWNACCFAI